MTSVHCRVTYILLYSVQADISDYSEPEEEVEITPVSRNV